jgi:hypothetical protein
LGFTSDEMSCEEFQLRLNKERGLKNKALVHAAGATPPQNRGSEG